MPGVQPTLAPEMLHFEFIEMWVAIPSGRHFGQRGEGFRIGRSSGLSLDSLVDKCWLLIVHNPPIYTFVYSVRMILSIEGTARIPQCLAEGIPAENAAG